MYIILSSNILRKPFKRESYSMRYYYYKKKKKTDKECDTKHATAIVYVHITLSTHCAAPTFHNCTTDIAIFAS